MKKIKLIFINSIPVLLMIGLIPIVSNDYILTGIYIFISLVSLMIYWERNDGTVYLL
jgi:hypothetical protein